jgi:hypothetical protein
MRQTGWKPGKGAGKHEDGVTEVTAWDNKPAPPREGLGFSKPHKNSKRLKIYCRIDPAGEHQYGYIKYNEEGTEVFFQLVRITPLGKTRITGETIPLDFEPAEVVWWGTTIMGPAEFTYPHPAGWVVPDLDRTCTLEKLNVAKLTALFRRNSECEPTCMRAWPARLSQVSIPWAKIAANLHSKLTTNKDISSWFKNILHRRLCVRSLKPHDHSTKCRLCNITFESILHLAACPILHSTFSTFLELVNSTTALDVYSSPLLKLLGCYPDKLEPTVTHALPKGLYSLFLMMWKFMILSFTQVDTDGQRYIPMTECGP